MMDFKNKTIVANEIKFNCLRMDYVRAAYFVGIMQCMHGVDTVPIAIVQAIISATFVKPDYKGLSILLDSWEV